MLSFSTSSQTKMEVAITCDQALDMTDNDKLMYLRGHKDFLKIKDGQKRETMRRYQRAVQRQMEKGARVPMKLSEYLEANRLKRETDDKSLSD